MVMFTYFCKIKRLINELNYLEIDKIKRNEKKLI